MSEHDFLTALTQPFVSSCCGAAELNTGSLKIFPISNEIRRNGFLEIFANIKNKYLIQVSIYKKGFNYLNQINTYHIDNM